MVLSSASSMSLAEADLFLKQFSRLNPEPSLVSDRGQIQAALHQVVAHSDYQILGICADSLAQAQEALGAYGAALGYSPVFDGPALEGSVYLKFNPRSGLCYVDGYSGEYRGVLVSCQSADADGINQMYGHLPLDLFAAV